MSRTVRLAETPQEDRHVAIEQGRHAGIALGYLTQRIEKLQEVVLSNLLSKHRSGKLTEADLRGGIGEIAGLRNMVEALRNDVTRANQAQEEEYR